MKIVSGIEDLKPAKKGSVVAIGVFDGVHLGHQAVIAEAVNQAGKRNAEAVVVTFEPHPLRVVKPESRLPILTSLKLKIKLIEQLRADTLVIIKFTEELSQLEPKEFVDRFLAKLLHTICVVVGEEFRFGKGASGDVDFLKRYGQQHNFDVVSVPLVLAQGKPISSTRARKLLSEGKLERAKDILGRYPRITGLVVKGHGRGGRVLGFPTANIETPDVGSVPGQGVYAGWIRLNSGKRHICVINIGTSPTFEKQSNKIEIHIHVPGIFADLYSKQVEVELQLRIRDEKSFPNEKALMEQIADDIEVAKKVLLPKHQ